MKTSELTGTALDWAVAKCEGLLHDDGTVSDYWQPSELWEQGGAIIEKETIAIFVNGDDEWAATDGIKNATGKTPLIAAMRCYVASKLGDAVNVPAALMEAA